jgi:hypothetical protein
VRRSSYGTVRNGRKQAALASLAALLLDRFAVGVSPTLSEDGDEGTLPARPTPTEMAAALNPSNTAHLDLKRTDWRAVQGLPHRGLDRIAAPELMEGVFSAQLDNPARVFGEFEPELFLSDEVAVVTSDDLPELAGVTDSDYDGPVLLQFSI